VIRHSDPAKAGAAIDTCGMFRSREKVGGVKRFSVCGVRGLDLCSLSLVFGWYSRRYDTDHDHYGLSGLRENQYVAFHCLQLLEACCGSLRSSNTAIPKMQPLSSIIANPTSAHPKPHPPTPPNLQTRPPQKRIRRHKGRHSPRLLRRGLWFL
jgi:hypothetical protein